LQPPFFVRGQELVSNYGGIGAVLGHEITHGFDDRGRRFDASGTLHDLWSSDVTAAFEERVQCLADQFSSYEVLPGVYINGKLTLAEVIADLGGLLVAYDAFQRVARAEPIRGYTASQQFFLAFAQLYCENRRPESSRQQVIHDPHPPAPFRVNGAFLNVPAFAEAFHCDAPAPSIAAWGGQTCQVW
jgi:predicted metalloendopeptidase